MSAAPRGTRIRARHALLALVPVLVAACSLPLPSDVRTVGEVPAGQPPAGPLQVIPPRPKADATPVETVLGFLGAQASSEGSHAVARQFLSNAERQRWRDDANVQVYDPNTLELQQAAGSGGVQTVVRVVARVSGTVRADGSYVARPDVTVAEDYHLIRGAGRWLLDDVPDGLRLTAADRRRAFAAYPIYYLAPTSGDARPHLVPDQVFLPVGPDLARALVTRLLRPPSQGLAGSVETAVPAGTRVRAVHLASSGDVTVDLTTGGARPTGDRASALSAQLVWTLRSLGASFRGLRLRLDGQRLDVPDQGDVQEASAWAAYDPQGLGVNPPYFFVTARRLRASIDLPASPATAGDVGAGRAAPVDAVAATPDRTTLALLEKGGSAPDTVRVGALRGTSFPVVARGFGLSSPTWGSGDRGLWLLRSGREVVRVDSGLRPVPVQALPAGPLTGLALSRDGARVALVAAGRLYVGRVELASGAPRVVGLTLVLPGLHDATRVAWASSTDLVVLGVLTRASQVIRVSMDGSSVQPLNTAGLDPTQVTASPAGTVLLSDGRLYLSSGGAFRVVVTAGPSAPAYPG